MKYNTYKAIMVGYLENHIIDKYKLYNPDTKRVIMIRFIKWAEWKIIDPEETMKMFRDLKEDYLVPGIEEYKTSAS